jgi:hypothetical protein
MLTVADVNVLPMGIVDSNKFALVCFWIELWRLLVRQKNNYLESLYEFCSLARSCFGLSTVQENWAKLNKNTLCNVFMKNA